MSFLALFDRFHGARSLYYGSANFPKLRWFSGKGRQEDEQQAERESP